MEFGSLLDSILTKGKKTMDEYVIFDAKVPKAEREAMDYILQHTHEPFDSLSSEFLERMFSECAYQQSLKPETRYKKVAAYRNYYDVQISGKKVISQKDWDDACQMAMKFREDPYLKDIFGTKSTDKKEYLYQLKFEVDYTLPSGLTVPVRIMPDLLIVNHEDKTIQYVDLKTSSDPGWSFAKENFIRFRYDLEASVYTDVLGQVLNSIPEYQDYSLLPVLFTDISRTDKVPVTWWYDPKAESQANGFCFESKGKTYQYTSWTNMLDEIIEYESTATPVPKYIRLDGPNDILSILSNQ